MVRHLLIFGRGCWMKRLSVGDWRVRYQKHRGVKSIPQIKWTELRKHGVCRLSITSKHTHQLFCLKCVIIEYQQWPQKCPNVNGLWCFLQICWHHLIFYSSNLQRDDSDVHLKVSWLIVFWFSPEGALCNWLSICIMWEFAIKS